MATKSTFGLGAIGAGASAGAALSKPPKAVSKPIPKPSLGSAAAGAAGAGATTSVPPIGGGLSQGAVSGASSSLPSLGSGALGGAQSGATSSSTLGSGLSLGSSSGANSSPSPSYNPPSYQPSYSSPSYNSQPSYTSEPVLPPPSSSTNEANFDFSNLFDPSVALGDTSESFAPPPSSTQPTSLSGGGGNPYSGRISAIKERLKKTKDEYDLYGNPTDEEKDLQSKVDAVNSQLKNLAASKELGLADIQNQAIPLHFITGQQAALERRASAQAQALAAQAEPLTTKLARLQSQRALQQEAKKGELASVQGELEEIFNEQKALAPQLKEIAGNLIEYDPSTGNYRTVFSAQQSENNKPIAVGSGSTLVDPRTGKVIYSAPLSSEREKVTDDIAEFNLARGQGFKGSFVDFKRELANLQEKGSSASNLPAAYKEYQLSQSDPGFAQYLNKNTGSSSSLRPLTADQAKLIAEGNQLTSVLNPLYDLIKNNSKIFGPIAGRYYGNNPYNTLGATAESNLRTAAQTVGRYLEGGVLRKEDEDKYRKVLPQLTDTPQVAKNKLDTVARLLKQKQQEYIRGFESAGFNVSGFGAQNPSNKDPLGLGFNQPLSTGLNGSIKPQAEQKFPTGVRGGQCGDFAHKIVQFPSVGNGKYDKFRTVDRLGVQADQWRQNPKVGDVLITGENKTYGHVAVVNEILPNGVRVTESNYRGDEKVSHSRVIPFGSQQIYGAIRGTLKV